MREAVNISELRKLPLFVEVTEEESRCLQTGEAISVPAGHVLTREGEPLVLDPLNEHGCLSDQAL